MQVTLGLLAGGQATRLGGIDKAWMQRDGVPQVLRLARRFGPKVARIMVSANRDLQRYRDADLAAVPDRHAGIGPLGGLDALLQACDAPWLLTLPVDIVDANDCLLDTLSAAALVAGGQGAQVNGAFAEDDAGVQPLVALWRVAALREAVEGAVALHDFSVQALQRRLGMRAVRLHGVRFGNLNTMHDLDAAGVSVE